MSTCGPRGIRTLDLLNAIETRSQLRYGPLLFLVTVNISFPIIHRSLPSGPEGIRTPGLLSAIEARSQLRYRPNYYPATLRDKAKDILLEAVGDVKQSIDKIRCKIDLSYCSRESLWLTTTPNPFTASWTYTNRIVRASGWLRWDPRL